MRYVGSVDFAYNNPSRQLDGLNADVKRDLLHVISFDGLAIGSIPPVQKEISHYLHRDESSSVAVVGNVRLDNSDEIAHLTNLSIVNARNDLEIVARAIKCYGSDAIRRFRGDFSFAYIDFDKRTITFARDPMGIRALYYRQCGSQTLFGTDARLISAHGTRRITGLEAGMFVIGHVGKRTDTGFPDVTVVPPGTYLTIGSHHVQSEQYWTLKRTSQGSEQPASGFRRRFFRSVEQRLYGTESPAVLLSGGLDSSSICVVAARLAASTQLHPLDTYSLTYEASSSEDEQQYIDAVVKCTDSTSCKIDMSDFNPLSEIDLAIEQQNGLFFAPGLTKTMYLFQAIAQQGGRIVLHGHGGDETVGHGFGRLVELAAQRKWLQTLVLMRTYSKVFNEDPVQLLKLILQRSQSKGQTSQVLRLFLRMHSRLYKRGSGDPTSVWASAVRKPVLEGYGVRAELKSREGQSIAAEDWDRESMIKGISTPKFGSAIDVLERAALSYGIELRYPFLDTEFMEYSVSLPSHERLQGRYSRAILRTALEDLLPKRISSRQSKVDFSSGLAVATARHNAVYLKTLTADTTSPLFQLVDHTCFVNLTQRLMEHPTRLAGQDYMFLWRCIVLDRVWKSGKFHLDL